MKAIISEIKRFAIHDGNGIRTTVFFKGCPLHCLWCHNPEGISPHTQLAFWSQRCIGCQACQAVCPNGVHRTTSQHHEIFREKCTLCGRCEAICVPKALSLLGKAYTVEELLALVSEDREFYEESGGGVTLSGGECLLQGEFCLAFLKRLKEEGISTAVDTCGDVPRETLEKILPFTDLFLYDVKAYSASLHHRLTGRSNERILENLLFLNERNAPVEIRIPFVPLYNDGEMEAIAEFLRPLRCIQKVTVLKYHNRAGSKYEALSMKNTLPPRIPTDDEWNRAKQLFREIGNSR